MKGKLLLFGFEDLFSAPAVIAAVEPLGLEVVRVPREDYGRKLEELLPVLRQAGAGPSCLKAVLTAHNRKWTAPTLLMHLRKERAAMQRRTR